MSLYPHFLHYFDRFRAAEISDYCVFRVVFHNSKCRTKQLTEWREDRHFGPPSFSPAIRSLGTFGKKIQSMSNHHLCLIGAFALLGIGCSRQQPITEGTPVSGVIWEYPRSIQNNNSGSPIDKTSRVAVYSTLIVITSPDGQRRVVPLDQVSSLQLK